MDPAGHRDGAQGDTGGTGYAATFMGGNVGIGTSSPAQKLGIFGNATLGGTNPYVTFNNGDAQIGEITLGII